MKDFLIKVAIGTLVVGTLGMIATTCIFGVAGGIVGGIAGLITGGGIFSGISSGIGTVALIGGIIFGVIGAMVGGVCGIDDLSNDISRGNCHRTTTEPRSTGADLHRDVPLDAVQFQSF